MNEKNENLAKLRKIIDSIDSKVIQLLNERFEIAMKIGRMKEQILDPDREAKVLSHVENLASQLVISAEFSKRLYKLILEESRRLQANPTKLIGFQGEHGAYSEMAARVFEKNIGQALVTIPCRSFEDVIEQVEANVLDFAVIPIQNSLEGQIQSAINAFLESNLFVVGEVVIQIDHCLMALSEVNLKDIRYVYSHPQALAQCRKFLKRLSLEPIEFYDTAGAAKYISNEKVTNAAAIASSLAAKIYGLEIIKESIQDYPYNFTTFWILSRTKNETGSKASVIFLLEDKPGTLLKVLQFFKSHDVNLTRIVSVPARNQPNVYRFFVDFEAEKVMDYIESFIQELESIVQDLRFLGLYDKFTG